MRSFTITNADNTKMTVDLIRYFKFKTDCFLIYSIGEIDDKNYKKLYLVRIMEELGFPVVQTIKNEADWANMQGIVKKVLKELKKNNKKITEDLNYKEIEGIKIVEPRFFKLDSKLVDILASNYMEGETTDMNNELTNMNQSITNSVNPNENIDVKLTEEQNNNIISPVEPLPVYETDNAVDQLMPNIEATNIQSDESIENTVDNLSVNNMETSVVDNQPLESIDQTIMNHGEFKPIELDSISTPVENNDSVNQLIESAEVVDSNIDNSGNASTNIETDDKPNVINDTNIPLQPIMPEQVVVPNITPDVIVAPIENKPVEQQMIEPVDDVTNNQNKTQNTEVNYKELYEAIKADNEATNNLLNDVINQLSAYKQKYGELE